MVRLKFCFAVAFFASAMSCSVFGAVVWESVATGATKTITCGSYQDSSGNKGGGEGFNFCCDGGATIELAPGQLYSGLGHRLFSSIIATNGTAPEVTLDLSGLNGAPFRYLGNFHFKSDATLHIKGTNTFVMGSNENWPSYYPTFNIPNRVVFDDAADGKVVFDGQICIYAKPAGLSFEIADDAIVAVHNNSLGFGSEFTLTNYDLAIFDSTGTTGQPLSTPEGSTITIPTGRILYLFPCQINNSWRWDRKGGVVSNNVVLAGGKLGVQVDSALRLAGSITGSGDIFCAWTFSAWNKNDQFNVTGPVAFTGDIDLASPYMFASSDKKPTNAKIQLEKVGAGLHLGTVRLGNADEDSRSSVYLNPAGGSTAIVTVVVDRIECPYGGGTNRIFRANNPLVTRLGSAAGTFKIESNGSFVFSDSLDAGAVVHHQGQLKADDYFTFYTNGEYCTYGTAPETLDLSAYASQGSVNYMIPVTGNMGIASPTSACQVCVKEGATLSLSAGKSRMAVKNEGGTVNIGPSWFTLPTLWLDASACASVSNVVTHYEDSYACYDKTGSYLAMNQTICYTNGYPYVNGWYDWRNTQTKYKMWNNRYDDPSYSGHHNVMHGVFPYCVTGGLNGMDYISFGAVGVQPTATYTYTDGTTSGNVTFSPYYRLFVSDYSATSERGLSSFKARYVFLVFGSQQGGGNALLANTSGLYSRGGNTVDAPIFASATFDAWVNGVKVNPTASNLLNGGWQVITLGIKNNVVHGLGYDKNNASDNGGQNYAEVIFVSEEITDAQRQEIEIYLAEKWGLANQYNYPAEPPTGGNVATIYGTGTVNLDYDATLGGGFAGTVNLNGHSLSIEGEALPPTAADISTDGCVGWFDPEMTSSCTTANVATKSPSTRLTWLYDRRGTDDGLYALTCHDNGRSPWINTAKRGFGPARRWVDYSNMEYRDANDGNTLRFRQMENGVGTGDVVTNTFRTIVMAQDSVRGGGQPFVDGNTVLPAANKTLYKVRNGQSAASPIYPAGTSSILTGGRTYLDGVRVADPSSTGFQGCPEVLSVIPTTDYGIVCFEYLENSQRLNLYNTTAAIQGEILMYNRELSDTEREKVESYLSWKWVGKLPSAAYSSLTNATISGAGKVTVANAALLPKFAADCTADVTLTGGDMAFTLDGDVLYGTLDLGEATVHLPASCTISVANVASLVSGEYVLLSCGQLLGDTEFTLVVNGRRRDGMSLVRRANGLFLCVRKPGFAIIYH